MCPCQSELNEPITNSKATQPSWRTLFWRPTKCCQSTFQEGFSAPVVIGLFSSSGQDWMKFDNDKLTSWKNTPLCRGSVFFLKVVNMVWQRFFVKREMRHLLQQKSSLLIDNAGVDRSWWIYHHGKEDDHNGHLSLISGDDPWRNLSVIILSRGQWTTLNPTAVTAELKISNSIH